MIDFRLAKNKRFNSVTKSNTTVALPGIQKTITYQDKQHKKNKSSYLETISHLSSNVEYDKKDTLYVNKEQHTLKTILKKMNRDTMDLIEHLRPKPNQKPISKEVQTQTAEKEIENSKKMINILKHQIDNLRQKYNRMIDQQQEQEILNKISTTKEEIEKLKQLNIEQKVSVEKDSKEIVREFSEQNSQKLLMLETDQIMTASKLQKLKAESLRIKEEQTKLASKTKQADQMIQLIEDEYLKAKNKKLGQADYKKRQVQYNQKKLHLQSIKKKIDFHTSFGQVRYYKALKELQAENAVCSMIDGKTVQLEGKNKYIRDEVTKLQIQFNELKRKKKEKGKAVKDYLESERMSRIVENSRVLPDLNASSIEIKPEYTKSDSESSRFPEKEQKIEQIRIQAEELHLEDPNQSNKPGETESELKSSAEHEIKEKCEFEGNNS